MGALNTPHYQGYVVMNHRRTIQQMKTLLTRAHLERRKGTHKQAADYCKKDLEYEEFGDLPLSRAEASKSMWTNIIQWARQSQLDKIEEEYPAIFLRYLTQLKTLAKPELPILSELQNEWWYGATGTGKSRKLWEDYPIHYAKQLNKWWDGYDNEEIVAIEEWSPKNECTASLLKIWADRYPFPAEIKGGKLPKIRPTKLIVLSNYTMEQCFPTNEDLLPIRRRFKAIHFTNI